MDQSGCNPKCDHLMSLSLLVNLQTWHAWPSIFIHSFIHVLNLQQKAHNFLEGFPNDYILFTRLTIIANKVNTHRHTLTWAQALRTARVSMVAMASLYCRAAESLPAWTLTSDDTKSWWTRRRSWRLLTTPLPIQALHTCRRIRHIITSEQWNSIWRWQRQSGAEPPALLDHCWTTAEEKFDQADGHLTGFGGDVWGGVGAKGWSEGGSNLTASNKSVSPNLDFNI